MNRFLSRRVRGVFVVVGALCAFVCVPVGARAGFDHEPEVHVYSSGDLTRESTFMAFPRAFKGGAEVAAADVDGDGKQEIIVAAGIGGGPQVIAYNLDGSISSFNHFVFHHEYRGGISIATGDVDGDGNSEIVVAQKRGDGRVKVYRRDGTVISSFLPYTAGFTSGANVAVGDLNGDGKAEILTATNVGARSHVRSFDKNGNPTGLSIFPIHPDFRGGTDIAAGDLDGDGSAEIVLGPATSGTGRVFVYAGNGSNMLLYNFLAYPDSHRGGVRLALGDIDQDGSLEIVTGIGSIGAPHVRAFEENGTPVSKINFFPYGLDFRGGVNIAVGDLDNDSTRDIITMPSRFDPAADSAGGPKRIVVDLSEQRLYAYEGGRVVRSYLISSGIARFPTPVGNFSVRSKIPVKGYGWTYGAGNPLNYRLPNVKWNLNVTGPYYIHGAYWHNNFGHRMSHGCINMRTSEAEWVYHWASVGTPVRIQP